MGEALSLDEMPNLWRNHDVERLDLFGNGFAICHSSTRRGLPPAPTSDLDLQAICDTLEKELSRLWGPISRETKEAPPAPSGQILDFPEI
jgi:hypothetical protein